MSKTIRMLKAIQKTLSSGGMPTISKTGKKIGKEKVNQAQVTINGLNLLVPFLATTFLNDSKLAVNSDSSSHIWSLYQ